LLKKQKCKLHNVLFVAHLQRQFPNMWLLASHISVCLSVCMPTCKNLKTAKRVFIKTLEICITLCQHIPNLVKIVWH
jgi:hypothetical protein